MKNSWFRFNNAATDQGVAEIHIIDFIGDWIDDYIKSYYGDTAPVTAKSFIEELAKLPENVKTLHVHINSPGGDVMGGINIANALREQQSKGRTVETFVDGIAASIASVIAMAGSKVHIADNALMMVHNPWSLAIGNAADMRKMADTLDTIRGQIVATYKWHSTKSDDELVALLDAETWLDADAAIEAGLATHKVEGLKAAAALDPRAMARMSVPEKYRARVEALVTKPAPAPQPAAAADVLRLCFEADLDIAFAQTLIADNGALEQVQARVAAEKTTRSQARERETQIRALCATSKQPELADGYVAGGMTVDGVRAHLTVITAKLDKVEIDGSLKPDHGTTPKARIDTAAVYAELNGTKKKE